MSMRVKRLSRTYNIYLVCAEGTKKCTQTNSWIEVHTKLFRVNIYPGERVGGAKGSGLQLAFRNILQLLSRN